MVTDDHLMVTRSQGGWGNLPFRPATGSSAAAERGGTPDDVPETEVVKKALRWPSTRTPGSRGTRGPLRPAVLLGGYASRLRPGNPALLGRGRLARVRRLPHASAQVARPAVRAPSRGWGRCFR